MTDPVVNLTVNNYNLTMKCLPDNENFNYKWIKKNDVLPSGAWGVNTSQLTIINLKPEDSGDYQCVLNNNTGTITSNFSAVNVIGMISMVVMIAMYNNNYMLKMNYCIFDRTLYHCMLTSISH